MPTIQKIVLSIANCEITEIFCDPWLDGLGIRACWSTEESQPTYRANPAELFTLEDSKIFDYVSRLILKQPKFASVIKSKPSAVRFGRIKFLRVN